MSKFFKRLSIALISISLLGGGEAQAKAPKSEIDKAISRCVASVVIGGLLGAVIGGSSGRGNAGKGALIGTAAGGAVCVVLIKVAKDKDALLAAQRQQVAMGGEQETNLQGREGPMVLRSKIEDVTPISTGTTPSQICRYATSEVEVPGSGAAPLGRQLYCRNGAGDWDVSASTI